MKEIAIKRIVLCLSAGLAVQGMATQLTPENQATGTPQSTTVVQLQQINVDVNQGASSVVQLWNTNQETPDVVHVETREPWQLPTVRTYPPNEDERRQTFIDIPYAAPGGNGGEPDPDRVLRELGIRGNSANITYNEISRRAALEGLGILTTTPEDQARQERLREILRMIENLQTPHIVLLPQTEENRDEEPNVGPNNVVREGRPIEVRGDSERTWHFVNFLTPTWNRPDSTVSLDLGELNYHINYPLTTINLTRHDEEPEVEEPRTNGTEITVNGSNARNRNLGLSDWLQPPQNIDLSRNQFVLDMTAAEEGSNASTETTEGSHNNDQ